MHHRSLNLLALCATISGIVWITSTSAVSQVGPPKQFVGLQPTTPGSSQSGHANISGTMRAGNFIGNGSGLTNLSASQLILPYTGSATVNGFSNAAFKLTNLGTGLGLHVITGATTIPPTGQSAIYGVSQLGVGIFGASDSTIGIDGYSPVSHGVRGRTDANNFAGVHGFAVSNLGYGVYGTSPTVGVYGIADNLTGFTKGVHGRSSSIDGAGVYGQNTSSTGDTSGVYGESASATGRGLFGFASSDTGLNYGVYGVSASSSGVGVSGYVSTSTGSTYGVVGTVYSSSGVGVFGQSLSTTGFARGIWGSTASTGGRGVYGNASASSGSSVGVEGLAASSAGYGVAGHNSSATGTAVGVFGTTVSGSGISILGINSVLSGSTVGVEGRSSSSSGRGVVGTNSSTSGTSYGVFGSSSSASGRGVYGTNSAVNGIGVFGNVTNGTGVRGESTTTGAATTYGVYGRSAANDGSGVFGAATSTTGSPVGVFGSSVSPTGHAMYGLSPYRGAEFHGEGDGANTVIGGYLYAQHGATTSYGSYNSALTNTGNGYGGFGTASGSGSTMYGLYGLVSSTTNSGADYGVYGSVQDDGSAFGVYGIASSTTGVVYGVRGAQTSGTGFGLYAAGDTGASGTKSFVIDHPFDPLNKYLRHFSMEAPKPWNLYRGTIVTDSKGFAWVDLPDYYESINIEPSIHLTVNDDSEDFVLAKVVGKVTSNRFRIRTSKPGVEVAWLLIADRNDPWVRAHPTKTEYEKPNSERGKLQAPEAYGYPAEMGVDFQPQVATSERPAPASKKRR